MLKAFVAAIYSRFETSVIDDVGMKQIDGHMGRPSGDRLLVRFHEIVVSEAEGHL